jgi:hypothetical protein
VQWPLPAEKSRDATTPDPNTSNLKPQETLSQTVAIKLCSGESVSTEYVRFTNDTPYTIQMLWLDYCGRERPYDIIPPGESYIQHTFFTHPWIAREVNTATRLPINGQEAFFPHKTDAQFVPFDDDDEPQGDLASDAADSEEPWEQDQQDPQQDPLQDPQQQEDPDAHAAAVELAGDQAEAQEEQQDQHQGQQQEQQQPEAWLEFPEDGGVLYQPLQRAVITPLPELPWSQEAHRHFPALFKAAVRTFLLCHNQLQQPEGAATAPQPAAAAAVAAVAAEDNPMSCWGFMGLGRSLPRVGSSSNGDDGSSNSSGGRGVGGGACSSSGCSLGCIPSVLLPVIVRMAAPFTPQHMELPVAMRPGILPTRLPDEPWESGLGVDGSGAAAQEVAEQDAAS